MDDTVKKSKDLDTNINDCYCPFLFVFKPYQEYFTFHSAEHEILNADKYENIKEIQHFPGSDKTGMLFFSAHKC